MSPKALAALQPFHLQPQFRDGQAQIIDHQAAEDARRLRYSPCLDNFMFVPAVKASQRVIDGANLLKGPTAKAKQ